MNVGYEGDLGEMTEISGQDMYRLWLWMIYEKLGDLRYKNGIRIDYQYKMEKCEREVGEVRKSWVFI